MQGYAAGRGADRASEVPPSLASDAMLESGAAPRVPRLSWPKAVELSSIAPLRPDSGTGVDCLQVGASEPRDTCGASQTLPCKAHGARLEAWTERGRTAPGAHSVERGGVARAPGHASKHRPGGTRPPGLALRFFAFCGHADG